MPQIRQQKVHPIYTKLWPFNVTILGSSDPIVNSRLSADRVAREARMIDSAENTDNGRK